MHVRTNPLRTVWLLTAALACGAHAADAPVPQPEPPAAPRLLLLDFELIGDLGGPAFTAAHEARLRMADAELQARLERSGLFEVVDDTPARPLMEELAAGQSLRQCNGCELDLARRVGASRVLVPWVYRVSNLILTLNYEIRDAASGATLARKAYDFRGDTDAAWKRAIGYMVRDLCGSLSAARSTPAGCR